jgi:4-hydroxy-tetrahydrodipicolinate synthase
VGKKIIFKGSAVALVTPFGESGSINFGMLEKLIDFQISGGTQAIVICGTTGESATLNVEEKEKIIKYTVKKVRGRIPVIAGTGSNCTEHAAELSVRAGELGADALLVVTPYYNKTSQSGIIKHYSYISERAKLPIIVYNVPSRTGVNILPETYLKLSDLENIVAAKEANGDISSVIKTISLCGENLRIYSGNDDQTLPIISVGGIGVISVFANISPSVSRQIACVRSDESNPDYKRNLLWEYQDLMEALFWDVNPVPVKSALGMIGMNCGKCRLPLTEMNLDLQEKLKNIIIKHKIYNGGY